MSFLPPWPTFAAILTGVAALAGLAVALLLSRLKRGVSSIQTGSILLLASCATFACYLSIRAFFVHQGASLHEAIVAGYVCTQEALIVFGEQCPFVGAAGLSTAGYVPEIIWTATSVAQVRLLLILTWLFAVSTFACGIALAMRAHLTPGTSKTSEQVQPKAKRAYSAPIVILFMGANPSNETRLALTREVQVIGDYLQSTKLRDRFRLEQQWETRARQVSSHLMRFDPTIVHFSGHGSQEGALIFQDTDGRGHALEPTVLAEIFRLLSDNIRCVVLNACYSESQARGIAQIVDAVVGMSTAIDDEDAIAFAGAFYEALGYGKSVQTAFGLATASAHRTAAPTLHTKPGTDAANLFIS